MPGWTVHGDGRSVRPGEIVAPDERLGWSRMTGIAAQHVVAMFGATFLVPLLTGFPPTTTLLFSGVGTLLFAAITRGRVPSYLGSSFAFVAPVIAASAGGGIPEALGGIVVVGLGMAAVGLVVQRAGTVWVDRVLPPVVTGTIVALIGLNLAPVAYRDASTDPWAATVSLAVTLLAVVAFRGFLSRMSVLLGVATGYAVAAARGGVDLSGVETAAWLGLPPFTTPVFTLADILLFAPVVLVTVAENIGHVKAVAAMTGRPLDDMIGRALVGDGLATTLAGSLGGSGTTTYAENIGVMAATRIYSSAAYLIAGGFAVALSLSPKVGAVIASIPEGVLGGVTFVLFGMIAVLGARIWLQGRVDLADPVNLMTAAVGLTMGAANVTLVFGPYAFTGIAVGSFAALAIFHALRAVGRWRGTAQPPGGGEPGDGVLPGAS